MTMKTIEGLYNWDRHAENATKRAQAIGRQAAAKAAERRANDLPAPGNEADLKAAIDQYNEVEAIAHTLKRAIFAALAARTGYRMLRIGTGDSFNGTEAAAARRELEAPHLIKVESLGSE